MRAGGSLDLDALNEDNNQISDGNYATTSLLKLPIFDGYSALTGGSPGVRSSGVGGLPQLGTISQDNPVVGQVQVTRFTLQQPANSIQLVWHCLDENGNYQSSYPLNHDGNFITDSSDPPQGFLTQYDAPPFDNSFWAYGWIRLNGQGVWWPMSLLRSYGRSEGLGAINQTGSYVAFPNGGFSSLSGPISFFDWIGFWDGAGVNTDVNGNPNGWILAIVSANYATSSNGGSAGQIQNYAVPNSSGRKQGHDNANIDQKNKNILVPMGGRKKPC
jgi:hypothetical protein